MRSVLSRSAELARELLQPGLPDRYAHVAGVAQRAEEVCAILELETDLIVSSAWLHDIGYASVAKRTGFHPLDGARFVTRAGFTDEVAALIAFHAAAEIEAAERGLLAQMVQEFIKPDARALAVLTYCDMTVGPRGEPLTVDQRLQEIFERYEPDHVVHRSMRIAKTVIRPCVAEVERWLAGQSQ